MIYLIINMDKNIKYDISFCITCMNRFYQIKDTLKKNLQDNINSKYNIEFVLVDFGSKDGLKNYIIKNFINEIKSGYLKYFYTEELLYFHAPIAKNTSHKLANGKYLVNLDCDNYTGDLGGDFIIDFFKKNGDNIIIHQTSNIFGRGNMGRISMTRNNFFKIGGYNQSLKPMGHQDGDLINRAKLNKIKYYNLKDEKYNKAILNDKVESLKNCYGNYNYNNLMKMNMIYSDFSLKSGELIANNFFKNIQIGVLINIFKFNNNLNFIKIC